jgi:hypothetical protein
MTRRACAALMALACLARAGAREAGLQGARRAALEQDTPVRAASHARACTPRLHRASRAQPTAIQLLPLSAEDAARFPVFGVSTTGVTVRYACTVFTDLDDGGPDTLRTALGDVRCAVVQLAGGCDAAGGETHRAISRRRTSHRTTHHARISSRFASCALMRAAPAG